MRLRALTAATAAAAALVFASPALGAADIEGVWSFSGGQIAVQAQTGGSLEGTVIRPTTLADCRHPSGEGIWIGVRAQPDGQYFGRHQWFEVPGCTYIERGNTAFRVLRKPDGSVHLRVCFAGPERQGLQPAIAPDGTSANATAGCDDSDLVSPLPAGTPKIEMIASGLPRLTRRKRCLSRRSFEVRLQEPPGDALAEARVFLAGRRIEVRRGRRLTAPINLRGLPKGRYTVRITATTVLGRTITGKRRYRTCAKGRRGSGSNRI